MRERMKCEVMRKTAREGMERTKERTEKTQRRVRECVYVCERERVTEREG